MLHPSRRKDCRKMVLLYFLILCSFKVGLGSFEDDCCTEFFMNKYYTGEGISRCDNCLQNCHNLDHEWRNRISSVKLLFFDLKGREKPTEWRSHHEYNKVTIFSEENCGGDRLYIGSTHCSGNDLGNKYNSFEQFFGHYGCADNVNMNDRVVSYIIHPPVLPYLGIPATEYKIKNIFGDDTTLDELLKKRVRSDSNLNTICGTCETAINAVSTIPYLDHLSAIIHLTDDIVAEDHWRKDIEAFIPEAAYRESARNLGTHLKSKLELVAENTRRWDKLRNSSNDDCNKVAIENDIHNELFESIRLIQNNIDPLYNRYPAFAIKPVFTICSLMKFFIPEMSQWNNDSQLLRRYAELVDHFRLPLSMARLNELDVGSSETGARAVIEVKNLPYRHVGYIERDARLVCLDRDWCFDRQCMYDKVNQRGIYSHSSNVYRCFADYAKLVRTRFEEAFGRACDLNIPRGR